MLTDVIQEVIMYVTTDKKQKEHIIRSDKWKNVDSLYICKQKDGNTVPLFQVRVDTGILLDQQTTCYIISVTL